MQPGAGRPLGSRNALPLGAVAAIKALRHRIPKGTPPELAEVADEAFDQVVSVMRGEVHFQQAGPMLRAAAMLREEVCGKVEDRLQVTGWVAIRVVSPYARTRQDAGVDVTPPVDAPLLASGDEPAPAPAPLPARAPAASVLVEHGEAPAQPAEPARVAARWPTVRKAGAR